MSDEFDYVSFRELPSAIADFLSDNYLFLLFLLISGLLAGLFGGVAWEAHLGAFLFGMAIGPWLVQIAPRRDIVTRAAESSLGVKSKRTPVGR